jgi:EpsI family protein
METKAISPPARLGLPVARAAALFALLGAMIFAHRNALSGMVARWDGSPMYSFGYMVPVVAAFLIWTRRATLARVEVKSSHLWGSMALLFSLTLLSAGGLAGVQVLQQLAFLVALVATVLVLFGVAVLRETWIAWAYLTLMIPFWDGLTEPLHLPFQRLSAVVGVQLLQVVGVPAFREGTLLHLPSLTIEVARACSGVNYVVAVVALGIPLAYLRLHDIWRRVLLILGAVVIAALSNSLRVALIGLLAYWGVGAPLHGPFHVLHGLFVSAVGYVALFVGLRLLGGGAQRSESSSALNLSPVGVVGPSRRPLNLWLVGLLVGAFVLIGIAPAQLATIPVTPSTPLDSLPSSIGAWMSSGAPAPRTPLWDGADEELFRRYAGPANDAALVAVGRFRSQAQGKELVSHRTESLHRAATKVKFGPDGAGEANLVRLTSGGTDRVGYFWYEIDEQTVAGKYRAKWLTLWSALVRRRTDGSIIVVLADRQPGDDGQVDRLREFSWRVHQAAGR